MWNQHVIEEVPSTSCTCDHRQLLACSLTILAIFSYSAIISDKICNSSRHRLNYLIHLKRHIALFVIVIAEMLGLPGEDWPLFKQWTDAQVHGESQNGSDQELAAYFFQICRAATSAT